MNDALRNQEWFDAMKTEIDLLCNHNVWELVELPEGRRPVGSLQSKTNADGSVERCKARLVA